MCSCGSVEAGFFPQAAARLQANSWALQMPPSAVVRVGSAAHARQQDVKDQGTLGSSVTYVAIKPYLDRGV